MLIVFGGLPGTGKTTLARAVAQERLATYLRIDTIEQALRSSDVLAGDVGPAGYIVAYALAEANLRLGRIVVADAVNPLAITGMHGVTSQLRRTLQFSKSKWFARTPTNIAAGSRRAQSMSLD
jgi:predicted kinase